MGEQTLLVRFLRKHAPYNANEVAGFTEQRAQALCEAGAARYIDPPIGCDVFGKALIPNPRLKRKGGKTYLVGAEEVTGKANAWALWSKVTGLPLPEDVE